MIDKAFWAKVAGEWKKVDDGILMGQSLFLCA